MSPTVSQQEIKKRAKDRQVLWRLIFEGPLPPETVFSWDEELLLEADEALNQHHERIKKALEQNKGGG